MMPDKRSADNVLVDSGSLQSRCVFGQGRIAMDTVEEIHVLHSLTVP
jgi:hypothetical protein